MSKRKKILEKPDAENLPGDDFAKQIRDISEGLYYISETDAEISPFVGSQADSLTAESLLSQTGNALDAPVEERDFTEFFTRLTKMQDWFGDEERRAAEKFVALKDFLEKNLHDLKVFKVGQIQLDIYAVGLDAEGRLMGIKTKAVET